MINIYSKLNMKILLFLLVMVQCIYAQESEIRISGTITGSVSGEPLFPVLVSVSGTDISESTDLEGKFEFTVTDPNASIILQMPGYNTRQLYLDGNTNITTSLVKNGFKSIDQAIILPSQDIVYKDVVGDVAYLGTKEFDKTAYSAVDQSLHSKVPGLRVINQSGMPGHRSFLGIRGLSSIYGRNEPLVIIDQMIQEIHYNAPEYMNKGITSAISGFAANPFDVLDIADIESITVLKDAQSEYGSLGSNGVIYVNTQQKKETSTAINVHVYQGLVTKPKKQDVMNAVEFNTYLSGMANSTGETSMFPSLTGVDPSGSYSNNTDWQDEIFQNSQIQKYHIFLKGGDNIATYNISTGYTHMKGIIENTAYSRFNLRINGKINITNKFSFTPIIKLGTADSYLSNMETSKASNPIIAANLKPPVMKPYEVGGENSRFVEEVGVFNLSNPTAIVENVTAENKNFILTTSGKAEYVFTDKLSVFTTVGIDYNNARDNMFIPDQGLIAMDSARNSSKIGEMEYQSTQIHSVLTYNTDLGIGKFLNVKLGNRNMMNRYHYSKSNDMNSPTDDYKSLGSGGSEYSYLRTAEGNIRYLNYSSYYSVFNYRYYDKYYLKASVAYDGNSFIHENSRYNFYPSLSAAWRVKSSYAENSGKINDLKLRLSWGQTGNIQNANYDYSRLFYVQNRYGFFSTLARAYVPNYDMEVEKKMTTSFGADIVAANGAFIANLTLFNSMVNNLLILEKIPTAYGFPDYYSNNGGLSNSGIELNADYSFQKGMVTYTIGGNVTAISSKISKLDFLAEDANDYYLTEIAGGAELITQVGEPLYSFYGYKTNGTYSSDPGVIGPNGLPLQAGDVKFEEVVADGVIDDKDKQIIGKMEAPIYGGLYAVASKENFTVRLDLSYCVGNSVYNYLRQQTQGMDSYANQLTDVTKTGGDMPAPSYGDPRGNTVFSDRWIESGSYLRVRQLTFSYNFPTASRFYKGLEMYVTGSNLFTLSGYSGYDPEAMYMTEPMHMGVDYAQMPLTRSVLIGIKLGL